MKATQEFLQKVPLFERLTEAELTMVRSVGAKKHFTKDQVIFLEGETFEGFYIVLDGSVRVFKLASDGNETVLHILRPYKSFAEIPLFTSSNVYPACAQTMEDSTLFYIPQLRFKRLMEERLVLAIKISEAFASRLIELNKMFGQLSVTVDKRLARYILNEVELNGTNRTSEPVFPLSMSKKDLAGRLGVAVETLSRNLRKLKDRKMIRERAGKIFVLNISQLRKLSE